MSSDLSEKYSTETKINAILKKLHLCKLRSEILAICTILIPFAFQSTRAWKAISFVFAARVGNSKTIYKM